MKMMFKAFSKKLFGAKYERLVRSVFIYLIVYFGLYTADYKVQVTPFILYLMTTAFTFGVMWQALSSEDNAANMQNMVMLPFEKQEFVLSYAAAIGAYTFFTKTAALLAVLYAVSEWNWMEILSSVLCAVNAVFMACAVFSFRKYWYVGTLWILAVLAAVLFLWNSPLFLPVMTASVVFAFLLLCNVDGYSFYLQGNKSSRIIKGRGRYSVWIYFFRYLTSHKNYLMNTVVMWCAACALPLFFRQMESLFAVPVCFVILTLNTPVCVLLSCDHALEQAVRFLPGQKKTFCLPYCLFIFLCNMTADVIFLCSLQVQMGGVTAWMAVTAVFFSLQSAVFSVLLEWFFPVRGWKIESDLWHHPRKYVVPASMILFSGIVEIMPGMVPALIILLGVEITALLIQCWRC